MLNKEDKQMIINLRNKQQLTWWDLVLCMQTYQYTVTGSIKRARTKSMTQLLHLLNHCKHNWNKPAAATQHHMHEVLPSYIVALLQSILYNREQRQSLRTWLNIGPGAMIMQSLKTVLNRMTTKNRGVSPDKAKFDSRGFRTDAWQILDEMEKTWKAEYQSGKRLHSGYVMEVIEACRSTINYAESLARYSKLASIRTPDNLDNVPFHSEKYKNRDQRMDTLCGIVNTVVNAFLFYQSEGELKHYFDLLHYKHHYLNISLPLAELTPILQKIPIYH